MTSEIEQLTPDEARDLSEKLNQFAQTLSAKERSVLSALIQNGAQAVFPGSDVEGHGVSFKPGSTVVSTVFACGGAMQTTTC